MAEQAKDIAQPTPKRQKKIAEADFLLQSSGQCHNTWLAKLPVDATPDDLLEPAFWAHVAKSMRAMDHVEAWTHDGSMYAEYIVLYADGLSALLHPKTTIKIEPKTKPQASADIYVVKWIAPPVGWGVVRKTDGERVKDGFATQADAARWAQEHVKALTR